MRLLNENRALIALGALLCVLASVGLALSVSMALAHKSRSGAIDYEKWCCNGNDCDEIPDDSVVAGPNGWEVTLKRGQHPMVHSSEVRHVIPYKPAGITRIYPSGDGKFHLCLWPTEKDVRCFYTPPQGF